MSVAQKNPVKEKVFIAQLQREVTLNFITLRDDEWMSDKYGSEKLGTAFTGAGLDIDVILGIFFRVLTKEDKESILKVKIVEEVDCELKEVSFTDPAQKMRAIVSGQKEITDIIMALTQTRMKSNPALVEDIKKKMIQASESSLDGTKLKT